MEIEKNNRVNLLFEFYQPLLTVKQNEYMDLYYGDDYSLGEIAEEFAVSRQAVYDNLKRTEKLLESYENKLHMLADFEQRTRVLQTLNQYVDEHYQTDQQLHQIITQITKIDEE
ncbi:putative DNA-binding protein [Periweissella ghanensis]|uniref:UPF0122 protein WGH24286_00570 n=1 Tax=Periweissella ghanensis TaxID=467997 RepID=A0ABM8Z9X8_9LACO|nr:putative DNA-binding protein [Periweissella ghanensis]MCM0601374.1 putative DNA-binding protein [Periweissella ghanensis]CAH0418154.1 hypothetical protein WGH24286_00570 [Periweissella ghanensis]